MITRGGSKMSKSRGNVVSPASIIERYGADTARCYILFIGPPEQDAEWSDEGMEGVFRFLGRLWRLAAEVAEGGQGDASSSDPQGDDLELLRKTHWAIDRVSNGLRRFAFNTAIAAVMELLNECSRLRDSVSLETQRFALCGAASLLFPFAPHVCSDIYDLLTGERVWEQPWPHADQGMLERDSYELVCQINGKVRDRVNASSDATADELKALCLAAPNIQAHLEGKQIIKEIVIPGKLVNLVVR
jgi:leucyl-tRNA synthetase